MKYSNTSGRYALLDELRGLDLLSMMLYHGCWDLVNLFGIQADWYYGLPGHLWQQSICWVFILLSGFCVQLGHHTLRRGAQVFGAGALVTAVTLLFMPEDRVIFGVLTLLGSAMLLTGLLEKPLRRIPPAAGFAISAAPYNVVEKVPRPEQKQPRQKGEIIRRIEPPRIKAKIRCNVVYIQCLRQPEAQASKTQIAYRNIAGKGERRQRMEPLHRSVCPPLGWLGRHSLLLYLLHQPVIYGVLLVFFRVLGG